MNDHRIHHTNSGRTTGSRIRGFFGVFVIVLTALLAVTVGVSGASKPDRSSTNLPFHLVHPGDLTIGVYGVYPPAVSYAGNHLGGIEGVWLNAFAKQYGLKVKLYETTFSSVVLAVEEHKVDVGLYFYYSTTRSKQVQFTAAFDIDTNKLFTKKNFPYKGPNSVTSVGSVTGFAIVPTLQTALGSRLVLFPNSSAENTALLNGQIQGAMAGYSGVFPTPLTPKNATAHTLAAGTWGLAADVLKTNDYNITACNDGALVTAMNSTLKSIVRSGAWKKGLLRVTGVVPYRPLLSSPHQGCQ
jgi:ABC-type amino acid transport substrate-binding protein